ncbi:hypothetical protein SAMN05216474_0612 [Lishizhenia tianjinensis]|uniref:Uncharacterized protein n=1 Tax=Lishizhenia tianjinensis TaxID=477690 RepID=A0A1I6Y2D5_9FLAO|nr:hypothetical protein [Lishizhenia tianjinensis]SFT44596.1 hypothetical protein SAMN05216474_0612 [Lishizhenia tianjinensis]
MKVSILITALLFSLSFSLSFAQGYTQKVQFTEVLDTPLKKDTSLVYCAGVELVWNEIYKYLDETPLFIEEKEIVKQLNSAVSKNYTSPLEAKSYYATIGLESEGIQDTIARHVKDKFNKDYTKDSLPPTALLGYAYLYKNLAYKSGFSEDYPKEKFNNKYIVDYFGTAKSEYDNHEGMVLHDYVDEGNFILEILCKDTMDQLLFAQVPAGKSLQESYAYIMDRCAKNKTENLKGRDIIKLPYLSIDTTRHVTELEELRFSNASLHNKKIEKVTENLKLELNKKGVRIESEVRFAIVDYADEEEIPDGRTLSIDSAYFVIMKRKDKDLPYFMYYVNGPEFMRHFYIPMRPVTQEENNLTGRWQFMEKTFLDENQDTVIYDLFSNRKTLCLYNNSRSEIQSNLYVKKRGEFELKDSKLLLIWHESYNKRTQEVYMIVSFVADKEMLLKQGDTYYKMEYIHGHQEFKFIPTHAE